MIVPNITPSFTTYTVEQKYLLEVEAGFILGKETLEGIYGRSRTQTKIV